MYRDLPNFAFEAIRQFGANVIVCQLPTGDLRWYIVRCYLAPGYEVTIWGVEAEMTKRPREAELIVAGDFNVDLKGRGG